MSAIICSLQGRFGNCVVQYLFCRALSAQTGVPLFFAGDWIGGQIFDIPVERWEYPKQKRRVNAKEALQWVLLPSDKRDVIEVRDYCQFQECMIYTKRQAQSWLRFRDNIAQACRLAISEDIGGGTPDVVVMHRRKGDYLNYGYPVVTMDSYNRACDKFGLDWRNATVLSEDDPTPIPTLTEDLSFVADFYRMVVAPTLLRANSTFSWVAGLLSDGLVLSPVIDGLKGGMEHDCEFRAGNHSRLANFDFTTDLYVSP